MLKIKHDAIKYQIYCDLSFKALLSFTKWLYEILELFISHEHSCLVRHDVMSMDKGKGEVLPVTGHEGLEGEQIYSSTLPSTSALGGGGWSTPLPGRFTPRKDPVPIV